MNLKKGKFKIVEGTRVRMVSSKDTHIVEGAYGTVVNPGIRESEVRWDSMLAIRADYRYRNELEDALIIPVYNDLLDPSGNFQIWTPEPIARIYLNDIVSKTDCKVIVSSSWRADSNLQSVFDKAGLKFQIYSTTPFRDHRGKEIQEWLNSQTEPYVYAILDDDREMLSCQNKFLVRTNGNVGITNEDANRVINILNRNDMWNDKLNSLIMESMKNHDAVRTTVLRAIKTEFSNYATAKNAKPLDNAAEVAIIKKLRDQRIDNAEQYRMVGRQDLYDNEMAESLILNEFLPEVPDDKVLALGLVEVCALQGCEDGPKIPKSKMGIIIKELKAMFPAADGKQIADLVKSCVI